MYDQSLGLLSCCRGGYMSSVPPYRSWWSIRKSYAASHTRLTCGSVRDVTRTAPVLTLPAAVRAASTDAQSRGRLKFNARKLLTLRESLRVEQQREEQKGGERQAVSSIEMRSRGRAR
jgi:hypothetical protein